MIVGLFLVFIVLFVYGFKVFVKDFIICFKSVFIECYRLFSMKFCVNVFDLEIIYFYEF